MMDDLVPQTILNTRTQLAESTWIHVCFDISKVISTTLSAWIGALAGS